MIAGPNGSGKSTLIAALREQGIDLGKYFNADDIAKTLSDTPEDVARRAQERVRVGRAEALAGGVSHSFETVMSHISHVEYMREAQTKGFEVRLYFVATDKPEINLLRVANRVAHGGHDVPQDRIISRYHRCLENLPDAIYASNIALIFDNSQAGSPHRLLAVIEEHRNLMHIGLQNQNDYASLSVTLEADPDLIPAWWLSVLHIIKPTYPFENGFLL